MPESPATAREVQELRDRLHALELNYAAQQSATNTTLKDMAHDVKNILQKLDYTVHRRELTEKLKEHRDSFTIELGGEKKRIDGLEKNQTWAFRAIAGAWFAGGCVVGFGKKMFA